MQIKDIQAAGRNGHVNANHNAFQRKLWGVNYDNSYRRRSAILITMSAVRIRNFRII